MVKVRYEYSSIWNWGLAHLLSKNTNRKRNLLTIPSFPVEKQRLGTQGANPTLGSQPHCCFPSLGLRDSPQTPIFQKPHLYAKIGTQIPVLFHVLESLGKLSNILGSSAWAHFLGRFSLDWTALIPAQCLWTLQPDLWPHCVWHCRGWWDQGPLPHPGLRLPGPQQTTQHPGHEPRRDEITSKGNSNSKVLPCEPQES